MARSEAGELIELALTAGLIIGVGFVVLGYALPDLLSSIGDSLKGAISGAGSSASDSLNKAVQSVSDAVTKPFNSAAQSIKQSVDDAGQKLSAWGSTLSPVDSAFKQLLNQGGPFQGMTVQQESTLVTMAIRGELQPFMSKPDDFGGGGGDASGPVTPFVGSDSPDGSY